MRTGWRQDRFAGWTSDVMLHFNSHQHDVLHFISHEHVVLYLVLWTCSVAFNLMNMQHYIKSSEHVVLNLVSLKQDMLCSIS